MRLLGGLLNENKLAELPEDCISTFDQDLTSEIGIVNLHFQSLAAGATAIERVDRVVGGAAGDAVIPADERIGSGSRDLFIKDPQAVVIAFAADAIAKIRSVFELPKGGRKGVFQR